MTAADPKALEALQADFAELFGQLAELQRNIHLRLTDYADGKRLKGSEIVGWLGEIYGKTLFGGALASDSEEHDFVTPAGWRISVKTRKGWGKGWRRTSAVPKFEGDECPSHLLFVHLDDSYLIDRIWFFDWKKLAAAGRFKRHVVRGAHRSYIFMLDEKRDQANIVYSGSGIANSVTNSTETEYLLKSLCNAERLFEATRELDERASTPLPASGERLGEGPGD